MNNRQKQWQLFFLGYYGDSTKNIDGIFGPKSEAATLQFRKEFFPDSIAHDSIFGSSTEAKSMEVVDRIQDILKSVVPDLVDDGLAGPKTMEAMKLYQESHLLTATGRVDDDTWELLMLEIPRQEPPSEPVPDSDTGGKEVVVSKNETTTGSFWDDIQYFKRDEFRCKCGGKYCNGFPSEPDERMVRIADAIRKRIGKPISVNSGIRCKIHNANVGGVSNSQHLESAADLGCPVGCTPSQMASIAEEIMGETGGIGVYSWGIHIDTRSTKSRWNG